MRTIVDRLRSIGDQYMNEWEPKLEGGREVGTGSLPKSRDRQGEGRSIIPGSYKRTNNPVMGKRGEVTRSYSSSKKNNQDNEYTGIKRLEELKKEINERYILDKDITSPCSSANHKISKNKGGMTPGIALGEETEGPDLKIQTIKERSTHTALEEIGR